MFCRGQRVKHLMRIVFRRNLWDEHWTPQISLVQARIFSSSNILITVYFVMATTYFDVSLQQQSFAENRRHFRRHWMACSRISLCLVHLLGLCFHCHRQRNQIIGQVCLSLRHSSLYHIDSYLDPCLHIWWCNGRNKILFVAWRIQLVEAVRFPSLVRCNYSVLFLIEHRHGLDYHVFKLQQFRSQNLQVSSMHAAKRRF